MVRLSPAGLRRTRKKHAQVLSYDGRCHPARSFGPFYGCLARERPGQDAVALFYPHNRCGSTLVFYPGRGPELFALPSLQAGPRYMPRRDGTGLPRTTPEFPFHLELRHQKVVLNTCVSTYPTLNYGTSAVPVRRRTKARCPDAAGAVPPCAAGAEDGRLRRARLFTKLRCCRGSGVAESRPRAPHSTSKQPRSTTSLSRCRPCLPSRVPRGQRSCFTCTAKNQN